MARRVLRVDHSSAGSTSRSFSQPRPSSASSTPTSSRALSIHSRAAQVGACTPLVTDPIGTSSASKPGESGANMPRLTSPCSRETPLARCASRRPMCAMLNTAGSGSRPSARIRSTESPGSSADSGSPCAPPKYRRTIGIGNRSMPAGTGVCVVNTVAARTTASAVSKSIPSATYSRMRSTPRKPAWPSFMWKTSGSGSPSARVNARTARTPPIPARISWRMRWSWSPP
ncbi:Uncharacterised protein [Mycobacteroides abscessus subsp. abscessus]|nr:Uncharacterised protein [Mycobacteroides abscessus subsp. abscessus]